MDFLSSEQRAKFAEVNARLGLGPEEFTAALAPGELAALPPVRRMSSTGNSDFPHYIKPVGSVEAMRKLVGNADFTPPLLGSEPDYPIVPPQSVIDQIINTVSTSGKSALSPELMTLIDQATTAYVLGDPEKVAPLVPLINMLKFPGRAAVFTGDKLEVPGGATHIIAGDDPVVLNYGQITVAGGASIKIKTTTYINAQAFAQVSTQEVSSALGAQQYTIENIGDPWPGPAQQGGAGPTGPVQPNRGTDGASNYNSGNCQWICTTQPGNGPAGNAGGTGLVGGQGAKGHPSAGGIYRLGQLSTPITMLIGGGDGQQGGKGGTGGAGGPGGPRGNAATGCTNNPVNGPQGPGGQGGPGGPGGDGGDSGYVTVYYSYSGPLPAVQVTVRTVAGGPGGQGGDPGAGPTNLGQGTIGTPPGNQGAVPQYALNPS